MMNRKEKREEMAQKMAQQLDNLIQCFQMSIKEVLLVNNLKWLQCLHHTWANKKRNKK
jgi:hypothetical protein|tara:strand:+ start:681 stop:854 length:174 start_codon:yes stop_codon:yes gene_type:complete